VSEGWAEVNPFSVQQRLEMIGRVYDRLTPIQQQRRSLYFEGAKTWIRSLPPDGICGGGPTRSFGPNPANEQDVRDEIRVDIKVYSGEAFSR